MTKGWLAAAVLVMLSASMSDLQMLDRPEQKHMQAGPVEVSMGSVTATKAEHLQDSFAVDPRLNSEALQAGLQSYPSNLLADTSAACALDAPQVSEATLAKCYQARLEASTNKDFRVWESLSRRLSTSSGGQLAEASPMTAHVAGQALEQG